LCPQRDLSHLSANQNTEPSFHTSNARREKEALHPSLASRGRGRLGGTWLARVDVAGASSSQTGLSQTNLSQTVDPTQDQHYQELAYQPEYQEGYQPQYHEGYQPQYQPHMSNNSMSSLLDSNNMSSIVSSMQGLVWRMRMRMGAFRRALMSCHFYRTSVNTWHASFGTIKQ